MNREIKFRAWVADRDMHYWGFIKDGIFLGPVNPSKGTSVQMQFTGLKDKNGKEIYEGDILKFFDKIVATVVWQDFGGWSYNWIDPTYKTIRERNPEPFFHNINLWEVIGNIYQHSHLLK